jgi:hypothetical protein
VKTIGREIAHGADKLEIIVRRLRIAELDIETVIAPRPGESELGLCTSHRRRLNGPAELHLLLSRTAENLGHAAIGLLAPQVVASKVHGRFAHRLANRKRRPDRTIHPFVNCRKIRRFCAQNGGREIVSQRGLDGLHGLVCPGFDRDRLSPTLDAVFVGQSHHDRRADRRLEELEFPHQFVVEPADFKANYPAHRSCHPPAVPRAGLRAKLGRQTMLVGHDATSFFLYLHHQVKGWRTRGRLDDRRRISRPFAGASREPAK